MRACDQLGVAGVLERAVEGAAQAHLGQTVGHLAGALATAAARGGQPVAQLGIVGVEAQADDMHGDAGKADRDLAAAQVVQPQRTRRGGCAHLTVDLVMIGQCPQLHPIAVRALGQFFGMQGAVGDDGMAMQVGVE